MTGQLRVGVVGGGIGGLALAHGLQRSGYQVTVFERDQQPEDTGGYRLHLTANSRDALRTLLAPELVEAIEASAAPEGSFEQIAVFDHHGRTRARFRMGDEARLLIGRRPLRQLLATGLHDAVQWDSHVVGLAENHDEVMVRTDDGRETAFDLVVGADGPGSVVTPVVTGRPAARPSGLGSISGIVDLAEYPDLSSPVDLLRGLGLAIGPHGVGMFLALHHPRRGMLPAGAMPEHPYLVWSVIAEETQFSADITRMTPEILLSESHARLRPWSDRFHDLVDHTAPDTWAAFRFQYPGALGPWMPSRITLLGDAIHPMPPTAGAGASTALIDAANLHDNLRAAPLAYALATYQQRMLQYAPVAVAKSKPPLVWQRRLANPLLRVLVVEAGLPLANAITRVLGIRWT